MDPKENTAAPRTALRMEDGVTLIKGIDFECCIWLIEGRDGALLVDTGLGYGDLRAEAEALTDRPIRVVNTHGHGDHSGGNYEFPAVWMHPAALPDARQAAELTKLFTAPEEFRAIEARMAAQPTDVRFLAEGDVFDLGGRTLRVLEIPGHTPGDIALYDEAAGILFSGDSMVQSMNILLVVPQALTVERYCESMRALARLPGLRGFYSGHDQRLMPVGFLHDAVRCAEAILDGTADAQPAHPALPDIGPDCMHAACGDCEILYYQSRIR